MGDDAGRWDGGMGLGGWQCLPPVRVAEGWWDGMGWVRSRPVGWWGGVGEVTLSGMGLGGLQRIGCTGRWL